jgi:hypothetical protein
MGFWSSLLQKSVLRKRATRIADRAALQRFLETRANLVAQTTLYGYLRTRAGMRYPRLFDDDVFVRSINIAKWQLWLACLADLAVFSGGLLARRGARPQAVGELMRGVVEAVLQANGTPPDAGDGFAAGVQHVRARVALCDWRSVPDDDTPFYESPAALVRYAPILEELMQLDAPIVRNSVRFGWQDVRRELRRDLDAAAVLGASPSL